MESYLTVEKSGEGLYKEKGSKFIATAHGIGSEEDVKKILEQSRKDYYDARHHCYAFSLGLKSPYTRANDDGEPNHSAGDPILGQIKSKNLHNTMVVVVRYFGGTKLGVSGLIHAYKVAAEDAINNAKIVERLITVPVTIHFPYERTNEVMRQISDLEIQVEQQEFLESCKIEGQIKEKNQELLIKNLELSADVTISFDEGETNEQ